DLLAQHFLKKYNERLNRSIGGISHEAMEILRKYSFPGNVRELENIIERTVALESGNTILPESLPPLVDTPTGKKMASSSEIQVGPEGLDLEKVVSQIEKEILIKAIHTARGVKKKAAKLLKISFRSMRYRVEKYGLGTMSEDELDEDEA
ncbi:MAG: helix-turn-helix domain-containing protein, partial [Bdellovibrio sp.]